MLFLVSGLALGLIFPFIAVLLQTRGFDPTSIGLVTAVAGVAFTFAVPVWGHLGDVTLGRARAYQVAALGAGLVMLAYSAPLPSALLAAIVVGFFVFASAFAPLGDALAVGLLPDPGRQYGRVRMLSSLSFAVSAIAAGYAYNEFGFGMAPLLWAAGAGATVVVLVPLARITQRRAVHRVGVKGGSVGLALSTQPRLWGILAAVGLVYLGIAAGGTFLALRLIALGGQPSDVALNAGVSALTEVPAMVAATWAARRIGLRALFSLSALVYCACILSWAVLDTPAAIIATRLVSGVAYSGLWIALVLTMGVLLPKPLQASGQALNQMMAGGVAAVLGNTIGGVIYGQIGAGLFGVVGAIGLVGAAVAWVTLPARRESQAALAAQRDAPAAGAG